MPILYIKSPVETITGERGEKIIQPTIVAAGVDFETIGFKDNDAEVLVKVDAVEPKKGVMLSLPGVVVVTQKDFDDKKVEIKASKVK